MSGSSLFLTSLFYLAPIHSDGPFGEMFIKRVEVSSSRQLPARGRTDDEEYLSQTHSLTYVYGLLFPPLDRTETYSRTRIYLLFLAHLVMLRASIYCGRYLGVFYYSLIFCPCLGKPIQLKCNCPRTLSCSTSVGATLSSHSNARLINYAAHRVLSDANFSDVFSPSFRTSTRLYPIATYVRESNASFNDLIMLH